MQFIQHGKGYINVNRIVRIDADETGYVIVWLNEHNKAESFRLRKDASEVLQYLLST
jgi:hypothetical protein